VGGVHVISVTNQSQGLHNHGFYCIGIPSYCCIEAGSCTLVCYKILRSVLIRCGTSYSAVLGTGALKTGYLLVTRIQYHRWTTDPKRI